MVLFGYSLSSSPPNIATGALAIPGAPLPLFQPRLVQLNFGLQGGRGLEANRFSGLDFHRLSSPRVHAFAGLGFLHRKGAKAGQREAAGFFQFFDDCLDQIRRSTIRGNGRDLRGVLNSGCYKAFDIITRSFSDVTKKSLLRWLAY